MSKRIWKPEKPTLGWIQAGKDSNLTLFLPDGENHSVPVFFRRIPKGEFRMGSRGYENNEQPRHCVVISSPFYLGTMTVTQRQFACWRAEHKNKFPDRPDHPAENMDWNEAVAFCDWMNDICKDQLPADITVRLPTEAQWEYSCRAETETEYWSGDGKAALREVAWFGGDWETGCHAVGGLQANPWGLYDMHGNVWEWCRDASDEDAYGKRGAEDVDPVVEGDTDSLRVLRGGSWIRSAWYCRSAVRDWLHPDDRVRYVGFRLCLSSGPVETSQSERGAQEAEPRREREGGTTEQASGGGAATSAKAPAAKADWSKGSRLPDVPSE